MLFYNYIHQSCRTQQVLSHGDARFAEADVCEMHVCYRYTTSGSLVRKMSGTSQQVKHDCLKDARSKRKGQQGVTLKYCAWTTWLRIQGRYAAKPRSR